MSDPFHIAARALRSGRRICVDCGARYQLTQEATGEIECCDSCRARRARLIERLSDKFHLVPKEIVPKARQETGALQKCSDCGKEFQPSIRGLPLDACCEECHGRRVNMVDHLAEQSFRGWHPRTKAIRWFHSKRVWFFAMLTAALTCGAGLGVRPAKKSYHEWREKRHFARASAYFAAGDYRHAILDARNALVFNWENVEALRIVAKSHEALIPRRPSSGGQSSDSSRRVIWKTRWAGPRRPSTPETMRRRIASFAGSRTRTMTPRCSIISRRWSPCKTGMR